MAELVNTYERLRQKENNLKAQFDAKVLASLKKPNEALRKEVCTIGARLFGYAEQLSALTYCLAKPHVNQLKFVNDLREFDLSNHEYERMHEEKTDKLLVDKYDAQKLDAIFNVFFRNHSTKFVKALCQFLDKRLAHRKRPSDALLQELALLKCKLIYHFCALERIATALKIRE